MMQPPAKMKRPLEAPIANSPDLEELAGLIAETAVELQATDIVLIDLQGLVTYTDVFVVCSARNRRQVVAIAEAVRIKVKSTYEGRHAIGVEGLEAGKWVLVDFGEVVLHVFEESMRGFYDLDGLWGDAPRMKGPEIEQTGEPTFF